LTIGKKDETNNAGICQEIEEEKKPLKKDNISQGPIQNIYGKIVHFSVKLIRNVKR